MDELWDELVKGMSGDDTFRYFAPLSFFEKANAPKGEERRFGGISTTDEKDQEGENILQRGLDFDSYFMKKGWFNDNHAKNAGGIVGYPSSVQFFKKGARLPDGQTAKANLHWTEGYLLNGHPPADAIWSAGMALQKSGGRRSLGQSIEGKVLRRSGPNNKTIARALVRNVAITHCPVNVGSSLNFLAKALVAAEEADGEEKQDGDEGQSKAPKPAQKDEKIAALAVGAPGGDGAPATGLGEQPGSSAGRILTAQSLEGDLVNTLAEGRSSATHKSLSRGQAMDLIFARFPRLSAAEAGRMLDLTYTMKQKGLLAP